MPTHPQSQNTSFPALPSEKASSQTHQGAEPSTPENQPYAHEIKDWKTYLFYFQLFNTCISDVNFMIGGLYWVDNSTYTQLHGALKAVHDALTGVDKAFLEGIQKMQAGNPPSFNFGPSSIPNWPSSSSDGKPSIFDNTWQCLKPVLKNIGSEVSGDPTWEAIIAGLVAAGDQCVKDLDATFTV